MDEKYKKIMKNMEIINGWTVVNDKVENHAFDKLPKCVKERVDYFLSERYFGITFIGMLTCIFSDKEPESYKLLASKKWIPKSDEFQEWENEATNTAQVVVALYLIYGADYD